MFKFRTFIHYSLPALFLICVSDLRSQTQNFTWVNGSNLPDQYGIYGTIGMPSAGSMPGARDRSVTWTDATGNLWLFGGEGYSETGLGTLSDLWKYNVATNQWTWMKGSKSISQNSIYGSKGVSAVSNQPGGRRNAMSWVDAAGNLWMFGGFGLGTSGTNYYSLNDLWKYNITTNEWVWMKGDSTGNLNGVYGTQNLPSSLNNPGGREASVTWVGPSGNLYLLGGWGYPETGQPDRLNDFWMYNISTSEWTWIGGSKNWDENGIYGTKGVSSPATRPGARASAVSWKDGSGNFWLFGGNGMAATGNPNYLSDLWKYSFSNNQWTWVSGDSTLLSSGVYGTQGVPSQSNTPGARGWSITWNDQVNGNLWLFGGAAQSSSTSGIMNDTWKYNIASGMWTWIKGSSSGNDPGNYGTMGISSSNNLPPSRWASCAWTTSAGKFWLFGGIRNAGLISRMSDLWTGDFTLPPPPNPVGLIEDDLNGSLKYYPNPTNGNITLYSDIDLNVSITNELGQVIKNIWLTELNRHELIIENLSPGIYFIRAFSEKEPIIKKMVVEQ
jgi:N-acetylneuraminic acid mutarotase